MAKHKKAVTVGIAVVVALLAGGFVAARSWNGTDGWHIGGVIPQPDVTVVAYPSYAKDIQPIFNDFCVSCHGSADAPNSLRLDSYENAIKGTKLGAVIDAGKPEMSALMALIKHETDPKIWMPYHAQQLSANRIKNIENWIRYGARNN